MTATQEAFVPGQKEAHPNLPVGVILLPGGMRTILPNGSDLTVNGEELRRRIKAICQKYDIPFFVVPEPPESPDDTKIQIIVEGHIKELLAPYGSQQPTDSP